MADDRPVLDAPVLREFSGSDEKRAIEMLMDLGGFDDEYDFTADDEKEDNLILSLGGSKRGAVGENSVIDLVKTIKQPWRVFGGTYNPVPVLIISGEEMDERTIASELSKEGDNYAPVFLRVAIPMISANLIPIVSPRDRSLQIARAEKIAETTVNGLAKFGEEQITRPGFMRILANGFTTYRRIFVHNDLWLDGQPYVCDNLFLERTPCILAALKKAVDNGTHVYFVEVRSLGGHRCKKFPYVRTGRLPNYIDYAEWTNTNDIKLDDPFASLGAGKRKTRRRRRSHVLTKARTKYSFRTS